MPTTIATARTATAAPRRTSVVVRAVHKPNDIMRNFLPSNDNVKNWSGMGTNYTGRISHGRKKSFPNVKKAMHQEPLQEWTDNWARYETVSDDKSGGQAQVTGMLGYIADAVRRVMEHNFKGDVSEPQWVLVEGWKGDTKPRTGRSKGTFHSRIL